MATFVTALHKIAKFCEYGEVLNDMLRDRIACGIRSKRVQQRLLQESELTYDKALNIAQSAETAEKDAKRLQPTPSVNEPMTEVEDRPVHKLQQRRPKSTKRGHDKQSPPNEACHRCGGTGHSPTHCN